MFLLFVSLFTTCICYNIQASFSLNSNLNFKNQLLITEGGTQWGKPRFGVARSQTVSAAPAARSCVLHPSAHTPSQAEEDLTDLREHTASGK